MSRVECRESRARKGPVAHFWPSSPDLVLRRAFTLVEVLVVMAIIAVIAALILPLAGPVKRQAFLHTAQAEMSRIETAIERYHSAYGIYPPGSTTTFSNIPISQLYYELVGMTNNTTAGNFTALDGSASIAAGDVLQAFGVSGFINCNKAGGDISAPRAQDFLPGLKPREVATIQVNNVSISNLVTSVGGPDRNYQPCGLQDVNPWRYVYPGTNNPGSYDLWVQLEIAGKTNLICNWSSRVQINTPSLP